MTLVEELHEILAEGPEREAENREKLEQLVASEEELAQAAGEDLRLQMILAHSKATQKLVERIDQLELLLLRVGIETLGRIEQLERSD